MSMAVLLAVLALACLVLGVSLIVQLDGFSAPRGRLTIQSASGSMAYGSRAQRRSERKASPVLYILSCVLALLVIATLV